MLNAREKLAILIHPEITQGERTALESLWGIGTEFYTYLFQCFKFATESERKNLAASFPQEAEAYEAWTNGKLRIKMDQIVRNMEAPA